MFKRVYYTLCTLLQHPRWWRGILACPHAEPLHYHHDGCPACYVVTSIDDKGNKMQWNENRGWIPSDEEMEDMAEYYK